MSTPKVVLPVRLRVTSCLKRVVAVTRVPVFRIRMRSRGGPRWILVRLIWKPRRARARGAPTTKLTLRFLLTRRIWSPRGFNSAKRRSGVCPTDRCVKTIRKKFARATGTRWRLLRRLPRPRLPLLLESLRFPVRHRRFRNRGFALEKSGMITRRFTLPAVRRCRRG